MPPPRYRRPLQAAALSLGFLFTLYWSGLLSPWPAPRYTVTDLGVLPGDTESSATAINSGGVAVGFSQGTSKGACIFAGGKVMSLGTLPGASGSSARALNSTGDVTGVITLPTGDHAFVYSGGRMRDLGTLPGFRDSAGVGINDQGEVAVNVMSSPMQPGPPQGHVLLYKVGRMTEIRMPPGCSRMHALSISNAGQIAGDCNWNARYVGPIGPFLYDNRTGAVTVLPVPVPYLRGGVSHINDSRQILGDVSLPGGHGHAVLWHGDRMTDLGTPTGYPVSVGGGLNNRGEVVGDCFLDANSFKGFLLTHTGGNNPLRRYLDRSSEHAFVYRQGKMQDLNDLIARDADWILESARGINDRGQIVGEGLHHGETRAFLLTPIR